MLKNCRNLELDFNLPADKTGLLTIAKRVIGNAGNTLLPSDEYLFSFTTLMKLARRTEYATPAQQIVIEDSVTCILKKMLDYTNRNVLKNFNLSLQQEPRRIVI